VKYHIGYWREGSDDSRVWWVMRIEKALDGADERALGYMTQACTGMNCQDCPGEDREMMIRDLVECVLDLESSDDITFVMIPRDGDPHEQETHRETGTENAV
jgi:hypothetical protein